MKRALFRREQLCASGMRVVTDTFLWYFSYVLFFGFFFPLIEEAVYSMAHQELERHWLLGHLLMSVAKVTEE